MELNPNIILNQTPGSFGQRFEQGRRAKLEEDEYARNAMRQQQQDARLGRQDARLQRDDDEEAALNEGLQGAIQVDETGKKRLNEDVLQDFLDQRNPTMGYKFRQERTTRDIAKKEREYTEQTRNTPELAQLNDGTLYDKKNPVGIELGRQYNKKEPVKAPQSRTIRIGQEQVTQEFDETTGRWAEIGRGGAFAPAAAPKATSGQPEWKYDAGSDEFVAPPSEGFPQGQRSGNPAKTAAGNSMGYVISQFRGEPTVGADGKTTYTGGILDKAMQGGMMGVTGLAGKVFDSQDQKRFDNLKQQMSTELRTLFRIPGEGALSDSEQKQYGLQLPDVTYDKANNEAILRDVESRIKLRLAPNPGGAKPDPRGAILDKDAKLPKIAKPKAGAIDGGYVFLGGDPANPKSWKKAK